MSDVASPLRDALREAGGVEADYHGVRLMRHFGDPASEYRAATEGLAVFDRSHRGRVVVRGRMPARMLDGILTGTIPTEPAPVSDGVLGGRATYHAVLSPKGKMITDLWAVSLGSEAEEGFLLDVPVAGRAGLAETFRKFLPPRMASAQDVSTETAALTVVGPRAAAVLSRLALGLRVQEGDLAALGEGEWRLAGSSAPDGVIVARTAEVWPEAYALYGPTPALRALWRSLLGDGATPAGLGVWSTLRVEAGRPAFGTDMDDGTIPVEAGIHDRAIDYGKGCYTGQEVIVRIRDRGHVNRHLRRLRLGDVPAPPKGAELVAGDPAKVVGHITSAVSSPKFGETVALAYVRRGVERVSLGGREIEVAVGE